MTSPAEMCGSGPCAVDRDERRQDTATVTKATMTSDTPSRDDSSSTDVNCALPSGTDCSTDLLIVMLSHDI